MEKKIVFEHTFQLNKEIRVEKKQYSELFNELKDHCGSTKSDKARIDAYKTHLNNLDVESDDKFEDLQEYLIKDLLETDCNILNLLKMKKKQESRMEEL
eukprot:7706660-Ditylum_brightwellii.AAC.1